MIASLSIFCSSILLILNVQFSILFVNSTEICTLFSVQTVAALFHHRAVTLYFNSEFLRLFACKNCRICPAPPTIGNISDRNWHYVIGLSPRHGSHAAAPTASNLWPDGSIIIPLCRSSRTDCHIGFGSCYLSLGYGSSFGMMLSRGSSGKVPCLSDLWFGERLGVALLSLSTIKAAQGKVSEILLFNFQRATEGEI